MRQPNTAPPWIDFAPLSANPFFPLDLQKYLSTPLSTAPTLRLTETGAAMDWTTQTEILKRIVALLLVLADLADRACHASRQERCRVLGILRQAEIVAQVADHARQRGAPPLDGRSAAAPMADAAGDGPADAAHLALRLRALSLAWATLLAWMLRIARRRASGSRITPARALAVPAFALAAPLPPDTS